MVVLLRTWLVVALSLAGVLLPGPPEARAEEGGGGSVHRAEDIVVEEQTLRPAEIFQDRPIETEILTAEEIRALPAQNAAEVVEKLPGIRTQQRVQGEDAAVSIEGMPPEYTMILVDGQRYAGEIGAVTDLADIPVGNIERIEILRGSQGLRYGTEAAGGVIHIRTSDPPREGWRGEIESGYGSDRHVRARGGIAWGSDRLGASLWVDHRRIHGYDPPEDTDAVFVGAGRDSHTGTQDANGKIVWRPSDRTTLRTRVGHRREDDHFAFDEDDALGSADRDERRWLLSQSAETFLGDATRVTGALTWYDTRLESEVGRTFRLDESQLKLDLGADHFFATGPFHHALAIGLDLRFDRLELGEDSAEQLDLLGTHRVDEGFTRTGLFLIAETELVDWAALHWGARLQLHSAFDSEILPQAALLLTPFEGSERLGWLGDLKIRIAWGRNHRSPSLRDLYQPPVPQLGGSYFLAGNEALRSESSTSWRLGFEYSPRPWIALSAVAFWNDIDDHIRSSYAGTIAIGREEIEVEVPAARPGLDLICSVTGNFFPECAALGGTVDRTIVQERRRALYRKRNLDTVRTRGIEARLDLRPWSFLSFHVGYTLLDTEVVDSNLVDLDELPNEPRHVVDAKLVLTAPRAGTRLALRGRWRDRALTEASGTGLLGFASSELSDPSLVLDARLTQPLGGLVGWEPERLALYVDVTNATDEEVVDSYAIRGRSLLAGLRMRFR